MPCTTLKYMYEVLALKCNSQYICTSRKKNDYLLCSAAQRAQMGAPFGKEWRLSGITLPSSLFTIILFPRSLLALSALRSRLLSSRTNSSNLHSKVCRTNFSSLGFVSSCESSSYTLSSGDM